MKLVCKNPMRKRVLCRAMGPLGSNAASHLHPAHLLATWSQAIRIANSDTGMRCPPAHERLPDTRMAFSPVSPPPEQGPGPLKHSAEPPLKHRGEAPHNISQTGSEARGEGRAVFWCRAFCTPAQCQRRLPGMRDCYPMFPYSEGCYRTDSRTY